MKKKLIFSILLISNWCIYAQNAAEINSLKNKLMEGQYQEVLGLVDKRIEKAEGKEKALLLLVQAKASLRSGDLDLALNAAKQADRILEGLTADYLLKAELFNTEGAILIYKGRHDLGLDFIEKAMENLKINASDSSLIMADCFNNLGLVHWYKGNNELAVKYHKQALTLKEKHLGKAHPALAATYNNLGLVLASKKPLTAFRNYKQALEIYKNYYGEKHQSVVTAMNNMAVSLYNKGDYEAALNKFGNSLAIQKQLTNGNRNGEAFIYSFMGRILLEKNSLDSAYSYQSRALAIYKESYGEKHPEVANTLNLQAAIVSSKRDYEEALHILDKALEANNVTISAGETWSHILKQGAHLSNQTLITTLRIRSETLEKKHFNKTLLRSDLKEAISCIDASFLVAENMRKTLVTQSDKIALGHTIAQLAEDGIRISLELSEITFKKKVYEEKAFYYVEKSKSSLLLEAVSNMKADNYANVSHELLIREQELLSRIAFYEAKKNRNISSQQYMDSLRSANKDFAQFLDTLKLEHKKYYELKYDIKPVSIAELSASIPAGRVMLNYFVAPNSQRLYIFEISKKGLYVHNKKWNERAVKKVKALQNTISNHVKGKFQSSASFLGALLIPKHLNGKYNSLIIIPHGELSYVPFETLICGKNRIDEEDYSKINYLVKKYAINYVYSATLFYQGKETAGASTVNSMLLCAVSDFSFEPTQPDLNETVKEVKLIEGVASKSKLKIVTKINENANEYDFKTLTQQSFDIIHVSTHGKVNERYPDRSEILFFPNEKYQQDGHLFSNEIYELNMSASLLVLPICETGLGKVNRGEGLIGLSRAFLYAGIDNLIVSYWKVSDLSTRELMVEFYKEVFKTQSISGEFSSPLRLAKLKMIADKQFADPYFWAPFVLIGK